MHSDHLADELKRKRPIVGAFCIPGEALRAEGQVPRTSSRSSVAAFWRAGWVLRRSK